MPARRRTARITLDELWIRAREGRLGKDEQRRYFRSDPEASDPFDPAVALDERKVDAQGRAVPSEEIDALLEVAEKARAARPDASVARSGTALDAAAGPRLLAEGDSWFNLPFFMPPTSIDVLGETHTVWNLAMWGHEIADMVAQKQYKQLLQSGLYRHFLFSGGGNDVLGSIPLYVRKRKPGDTDPAHAAEYVKPSFAAKVAEIVALYATVAAETRVWGPAGTVLYVHGYANAIPRKGGKYIGKPMQDLDFDPSAVLPLARAVIAQMVGEFNAALKTFAAITSNVVYVDLRPSMAASDWSADEIHPLKSGSRKIAAAFSAAIRASAPVA